MTMARDATARRPVARPRTRARARRTRAGRASEPSTRRGDARRRAPRRDDAATMTMTIATHRATTPTTRARATRRATRPRGRTTRRASSSSETKTAATAATTTRREEDDDDDDAGVECVASTMGAECVIPEPTREARGVECVGVGMEASCDAEALADEAGASAGASAAASASGGAAANLALVSPFFLWGTSMVAMKGVLPVTSPMFVASVRLIPSGLILVAWALSKGRPMPKTATAWGAVAAFAVVDAAMFQGFLAEGLQRTSAGLGSVIIDSQPLTVAILASIFFGETLGVEGVAGLALGVLGLLLLELPEDALKSVVNSDGADALSALRLEGSLWDSGEWWMLLAAQSMAVGTVMVRWVCKYVDPVMATGWHMALGGVPLLAYSLATEPELYSHLSLSGADVASLLYASVFGGAVAYGAFFYFATKGSLTKLSSLTFLTPMFAAALGYLTLDETLSATQLGGAAVTLVGIYFVNTRAKEASAE